MFSTDDTIVAIATPPGRGGIGVVRVSGARAHDVAGQLLGRADRLEPRYATLATLRLGAGGAGGAAPGDRVVTTFFPKPASYTGEDVVEISAHGSPVILRAIVTRAIDLGARLAEPGEFTLRAFLNGRMDLPQAEAVADLIDAVTPLQARAAFDQLQGTLTAAICAIDRRLFDLIARLEASVDFPEEGYHFAARHDAAAEIEAIEGDIRRLLAQSRQGRLVREGLQIAIVGAPNAGKSTLFNALVGASRAIVTDTPGTTRDMVSETIDLHGLRATLVDTAGLRDTADPVEREGVARALGAAAVSDLILVVSDSTQPDSEFVSEGRPSSVAVDAPALLVANKSDLPEANWPVDAVPVSALTGAGLDALKRRMLEALDVEPMREVPAVTNMRHVALLERALASLARARGAALAGAEGLSEEFVLADLQQARQALEEVTGRRTPDDLLAHIFSRFCIGK